MEDRRGGLLHSVGRLGTDCARCMAVCPYSHPDNAMHSLVRWGIRNNGLFRKGALWMDDLVYGRRPPPKEELGVDEDSSGRRKRGGGGHRCESKRPIRRSTF